MDEQGLKLLAIFCLLIIALIFGLAPLYFVWRYQDENQGSRYQLCFSLLNAFAGGVFMSIALLHLLPEVRQLLMDAFIANGKTYAYSWAEFIASIGFFFIVFLEFGVELCLEKLGVEDQDNEHLAFASHSHSHSIGDVGLYNYDTVSELNNDKHTPDDDGINSIASEEHPGSNIVIRACVLLLSLSVHSIFEGLSLGLQASKEGVLELFIAISIHKGIEALGVAVSVAQSRTRTAIKVICMVFFSLMSPIGIIIGMKITSSGTSSQGMVTGVLQGLATGTFLYITFLELLPRELKSKTYRLPKIMAVLLGFLCIAGIQAI
ncbi:zinc transporter ZIP1-like [Anneissia japonica]|uniref:zinc transporter ZIP1-like n=1 Tax=Anneissia japonica TaxID=1529436 RepID=UPI001425A364|nr:zinc transporter ZIP1-like [Anneissia japonica]